MFTKHRGEIYLALAALFFACNGIVATVLLTHLDAFRLAQLRSLGALLILITYTLLRDRSVLRATRNELPKLAIYGVVGLAIVNVGYFLGIKRGVPLGLVLIIEFTAPIWIALWIKFVRKGFVAREMWIAIALALVGLILVAKVWQGFTFDVIGILASLMSAFAMTVYFLMGEKVGANRLPIATTIYGLLFASLFWAIVLPLWKFPTGVFSTPMAMQGIAKNVVLPGWVLLLYIVVLGTIVPYLLGISGLRLLTATKSSVIGMLEPIFASTLAWLWLGQSWSAIQLLGGAAVLIGIYLADRAKSQSR